MMKLMRFKWKYLLASLLLANMSACSNDDLTQMSNQQEQDSGTRTAEWFTKTVTLDTAGTLETKLAAEMGGTDVATLEKLVVSGPFAAADMTYVRNSLTGLVAIDMKDAVITPSSDTYNPNGWDSFSFENDKICPLMFSQMTNIEEVVLPNTVTSVGEQAFYGCNSLNTVVIPDGVISIGSSVFTSCEELHTLILPSSLEEIGYYAFENCDSLKSIVIPDKVKKLDSGLFSGCNYLNSVTLSANLEEIGNRAFENCNSIKNINIPNGVKSIGDNAFYNCNSLESVAISASSNLETIGSWAFYNCDSLKSIVIPEGVKEITTHCFYSCDLLEAVSFPSNLEKIGYGSFWGCNLKDIEIPDGVTEIGGYAFYVCRNLASIKLPSELISIGEKAFTDCVNLTTLQLPEKLETIGSEAFYSCDMLKELTIPESVKSVNYSFVSYCSNLRALIWKSVRADVPSNYGVDNCFLFVYSDQIAVAGMGDWKAVIINGETESTIQISAGDTGYSNVKEFKANKLTYSKNFASETVPGTSSGWQTIVLPFTPDSIYHETKGRIAPFNSNIEGAKPFWLRELTSEGFKDVTKIVANKPYIIAMPNHEDYLESYRLNGDITFVARDSVLRVTPETLNASVGPDYEFHPTYKMVEQSSEVYVLTSIWDYYEDVNRYYDKSFFRRNDRNVHAFEAYVTPLGGGRSSRSVFDLDTRSKETRVAWQPNKTGIPQIGDM